MSFIYRTWLKHERWFLKICMTQGVFASLMAMQTTLIWLAPPLGAIWILSLLPNGGLGFYITAFLANAIFWAAVIAYLLWVMFFGFRALGDVGFFRPTKTDGVAMRRLTRVNEALNRS